ncbi:golgin subfamily A member 6-like protein 2 [Scomber scombrus]|uniref:Cilia- and flagella-associated protein 157 n=1 Tax=Scomber scombrus TaxID=13677 RepID=A0AAV1Q852_SCOSC
MADGSSSEENEKALYLKQIRYLDEQLERCQLKSIELEKQCESLLSQYDKLEKDKKDIIASMKHSEAAKQKALEEALERLESEQRVAEQDRRTLKMEHSRLMQQLQDQIDELISRRMMQDLTFQVEKEQLMSDVEFLKEQHEAAMNHLKADAASERANIMVEMQKNAEIFLQETIVEVLQKERDQHGRKMEQLEFLLSENTALWNEKDALRTRDKELYFEMDHVKTHLDMVAQESLKCKKELEQLKIKCQQRKVEQSDCRIVQELHQCTNMKTLRQRLTSVSKQCRQNTARAGQLGAELQEERSRTRQLEAITQGAVVVLRRVLTEAEKTPMTEWEMQKLLEILESYVPQGSGSALDDTTEESGGQGPARAEIPAFLLAKYSAAELGLVPCPRWNRRPKASRTDAAQSCSSNQQPLNRCKRT